MTTEKAFNVLENLAGCIASMAWTARLYHLQYKSLSPQQRRVEVDRLMREIRERMGKLDGAMTRLESLVAVDQLADVAVGD